MTHTHRRAIELAIPSLPQPLAAIVTKYALLPNEILTLVLTQGADVTYLVKAHPSSCKRGEHGVTISMRNSQVTLDIIEPQTYQKTTYRFSSTDEIWIWIDDMKHGRYVIISHVAVIDMKDALLIALAKY
jgi:hypothetical protein